jgi:hypothetical protein
MAMQETTAGSSDAKGEKLHNFFIQTANRRDEGVEKQI